MSPRIALAYLLLLPLLACEEAPTEAPPPTGLDLGAHPDITLPTADMAKTFPEDALEEALVIRVPDRGYRPAVRLPAGDEIGISGPGDRRAVIARAAEAAGRGEHFTKTSLLNLIVWADGQSTWQSVADTLMDCGDPEVRVDRVWFAVRNADGETAVLPCFLPFWRGAGEPLIRDELHWAPEVRIKADSSSGGFAGTDRLYRWFHHVRTESLKHGYETTVAIAPEASTAFQQVVDVLNEARRFGIHIHIRTPETRNAVVDVARRGFFLPDGLAAWTLPDTDVPPRRPGRAVAKDPDRSTRMAYRFVNAFHLRAPPHMLAGGPATQRVIDEWRRLPPWAGLPVSSEGRPLEWLSRHRNTSGSWREPRGEVCDPALTGTVLLAFFADHQTHRSGDHRDAAKSALKALKVIQEKNGCFARPSARRRNLAHARATLAMTQAYAMTGSPLFKQSSQTAVEFLVAQPRKTIDPETLAWTAIAAQSAKQAGGLRMPKRVLATLRSDLDRHVKRADPGLRPAVAIALARILLGENPESSPAARSTIDRCLEHLPSSTDDFHYVHLATVLLSLHGGDAWRSWSEDLRTALLDARVKKGEHAGSWNPVGSLGRIETTALAVLCERIVLTHSADPPR